MLPPYAIRYICFRNILKYEFTMSSRGVFLWMYERRAASTHQQHQWVFFSVSILVSETAEQREAAHREAPHRAGGVQSHRRTDGSPRPGFQEMDPLSSPKSKATWRFQERRTLRLVNFPSPEVTEEIHLCFLGLCVRTSCRTCRICATGAKAARVAVTTCGSTSTTTTRSLFPSRDSERTDVRKTRNTHTHTHWKTELCCSSCILNFEINVDTFGCSCSAEGHFTHKHILCVCYYMSALVLNSINFKWCTLQMDGFHLN